jgi:DNA invertase Pin-like site-specific DNA recombinase
MSVVGYARVSSVGQSLDVQVEKLTAHGCDKIYQEKVSGTTQNRTKLKNCLDYVRDGDLLVVTKLDRLARSTLHLTQIADKLKQKGVELVVLDQNIDTSTSTGKLLFHMLGAIAEFETEIRKERQTEGIAKAKENGVKFGRKSKMTDGMVMELKKKRSEGILIRNLMQDYSLSKASVYRYLGGNNNEN